MKHLQFFDRESCTFTYLIIDEATHAAAIIDSVCEQLDLYKTIIKEQQLKLCYILETHTHADHITCSGQLKRDCGGKIAVSQASQATCVDIKLNDGDTLALGNTRITVLDTPGHTDDSVCYLCDNCVFTGDTLFIRGTGRTDFQSGNAIQQYKNIMDKLFTLDDNTIVYPGHDYKVMTSSTIGDEKRFNPRLQVSNAEAYAEIMNSLNLARPKRMDEAVPANLHCGLEDN